MQSFSLGHFVSVLLCFPPDDKNACQPNRTQWSTDVCENTVCLVREARSIRPGNTAAGKQTGLFALENVDKFQSKLPETTQAAARQECRLVSRCHNQSYQLNGIRLSRWQADVSWLAPAEDDGKNAVIFHRGYYNSSGVRRDCVYEKLTETHPEVLAASPLNTQRWRKVSERLKPWVLLHR